MPPIACQGGLLYAVRPGQTLFSIARQFGVTVDALLAANPGIQPTRLQVGQILCVPGVADSVCRRGRLRVVEQGETLFSIAVAERVPIDVLVEANYWLPNPALIFPGEEVCIPLILSTTGCCIVLEPTEPMANNPGGSALLQALNGLSRVSLVAAGLPLPSELGPYLGYAGAVVFREMQTAFPLESCAQQGPPTVYAGVLETDVPIGTANVVAVFPVDAAGTPGPDVLLGRIINCMTAPSESRQTLPEHHRHLSLPWRNGPVALE